MRPRALGRGLWVAAWVVLGACGGEPGDGDGAGAGGGGGGTAGTSGATAGTGPGSGDAGGGGTDGEPVGSSGNGGKSGDGGGNGGGSGGSGGGDPDPVDECADDSLNDCGEASCVDLDDGFSCECDDGAIVDDGACVCDLVGTFAVRTTAPLTWEDAYFGLDVVIAGGSAESVGYGLLTITRDGGTLEAESRSCGSETPDLCSPLFSEAYGQSLPGAIWDRSTMPTATVTLDVADELPGGAFDTVPSAAFLGLRFMSGLDPLGTFPASATDPALEWTDDDDDGELGVTSLVTEPGATSDVCTGDLDYAYLPVDPLDFDMRATAIYIGARSISHIEGEIDDCDTLTGQLFTESVNGRVQGCERQDSMPCDATQSAFLDMHAKGQDIGTADFVMVRLSDDDPTCADALAADFAN